MRQRRLRETRTVNAPQIQTEAQRYEAHAITTLKSAGYRITMPRVQVIRALSDSEVALSAYAIHEKIVAAGGKIDVVSVYRILNTLEEVGLIHHIGIVDGYFPARTTSPDATASELLVDADSGEVRELEIPPSILAAIQSQSKDKGFEVTTIKLELLGRVA